MKIKTVSVAGQVLDYLKSNIENGTWKVGEKLPSESQLINELGVSRASIRTALQYLIGLGVLESYQGKGTFLVNDQIEDWNEVENRITAADCTDIMQVLEFRLILEPAACRMAVENATEDAVAELDSCFKKMKSYHGDQAKFVGEDIHFHEIVSMMSGNALLYKSLHKVFTETRKNHERMNTLFGYDMGIRYHTKILEAFKKRDAQMAYDQMYQHLNEALIQLKNRE